MNPLEAFAILQNVEIFREVPTEALFELSEKIKEPESYEQFSRIAEEGDSMKHLIVLVNGEVRIAMKNEIVDNMKRYDVYGLNELVTKGDKYQGSITVASERATVIKIPRKRFLILMDNHPEILTSIASYIGKQCLVQMSLLSGANSKNRSIDYVLNKFERIADEIHGVFGKETIERKFLLKKAPDLEIFGEAVHPIEIRQGYLIIGEDREERIRSYNNAFYRATKEGTGIRSIEKEWAISQEEFEQEFISIKGRPIIKTRYQIEDENFKDIHFDVFKGEFDGLVVAEVEFKSEEKAKDFVYPKWFGEKPQEITKDSAYKNRNLALHGDPRRK